MSAVLPNAQGSGMGDTHSQTTCIQDALVQSIEPAQGGQHSRSETFNNPMFGIGGQEQPRGSS